MASRQVRSRESIFMGSLGILEHCHVVEWAVYTANGEPAGKDAFGRPGNPSRSSGAGSSRPPRRRASRRNGAAILCAHNAAGTDPARACAVGGTRLRAIEHGSVPHTEGIGILRMTHLAHTDNTRHGGTR